jgi:hypothetical protein
MIRRSRWLVTLAAATLVVAGCAQQLRTRSGADFGLPVDINDTDTILAVAYNSDRVPYAVLVSGPSGPDRRVPGPGGIGFLPHALNASGVIVGETIIGLGFQQIHRAVRWSADDGFTTLPLPAGTFQSWATDVNASGTVVFNAYSPSGSPADGAYVWNPGDAAATKLPDPPGAPNGRPSVAEAISDSGVIVGASGFGSAAGIGRAVRWAAASRLVTFLGAAGVNSTALDVNERGTAVGSTHVGTAGTPDHAAAWLAAGTLIDLGPGIAEAINDLELVVGQAGTPPQAYLWSTVTRTAIPLGELRAGAGSNAVALNNTSRAVGDSDGRAANYALPTP